MRFSPKKLDYTMAYSNQNDILLELDQDTLVQLTDDQGAGTVDQSVVERALANAEEEINAYLCLRYSLPLSFTPGLIRKLSTDLAIYYLFSRKGHVPQVHRDRCLDALKTLEKLARGRIKIKDLAPAASGAGVQATTPKSERVFTAGPGGSLEDF